MEPGRWGVRRATVEDADEVARLLHDFNREFDTPSLGAPVLAERLRVLLAGDVTVAILAGTRRSVWPSSRCARTSGTTGRWRCSTSCT